MSDTVVRRGPDYRRVERDGVLIGYVRADSLGSVVAWDAYDEDRVWLKGFGYMEDAVQHLRIRSFRQKENTP